MYTSGQNENEFFASESNIWILPQNLSLGRWSCTTSCQCIMELTKVISNVKHGVCFFASFIFTACALVADFIALVRFSGINSRYMLLVSSFPSMRYSSKKLLWNQKQMKNILENHLRTLSHTTGDHAAEQKQSELYYLSDSAFCILFPNTNVH